MTDKRYEHITNKQLIIELEGLRRRRAEWETLESQCMIAEETLVNRTHELNERIKELNCLYAISGLVEEDIPLEEIFRGTVDLIPPAMQYPEIASARIVINDTEYKTRDLHGDCKLRRHILDDGKNIGTIEVFCRESQRLDNKDYCVKEDLIKAIAERLGRIIERKKAEDALRESEAKYSTLVEKARDGVVVVQDYVFKFVNDAMAEITGYGRDELMGMNFLKVFAPEYRDLINQRYERRLSGEDIPHVFEVKIMRKEGTIKSAEVSFGLITYVDGKTADMEFIRDITERIEAEEAIRRLAYHDALTGLPNRILFYEQFTLAQARAQRHKEKMTVVMLDLDHFKEVNDTLGHDVGDRLLQAVANRLKGVIRKEDVVARMGGDEFMILLQEITKVDDVVTTCRKIVESFSHAFVFNGHKFEVTTSVGIALYPEDGEDIGTLLKDSDIAMYQAKEDGRNRFKLFSQSNRVVASG